MNIFGHVGFPRDITQLILQKVGYSNPLDLIKNVRRCSKLLHKETKNENLWKILVFERLKQDKMMPFCKRHSFETIAVNTFLSEKINYYMQCQYPGGLELVKDELCVSKNPKKNGDSHVSIHQSSVYLLTEKKINHPKLEAFKLPVSDFALVYRQNKEHAPIHIWSPTLPDELVLPCSSETIISCIPFSHYVFVRTPEATFLHNIQTQETMTIDEGVDYFLDQKGRFLAVVDFSGNTVLLDLQTQIKYTFEGMNPSYIYFLEQEMIIIQNKQIEYYSLNALTTSPTTCVFDRDIKFAQQFDDCLVLGFLDQNSNFMIKLWDVKGKKEITTLNTFEPLDPSHPITIQSTFLHHNMLGVFFSNSSLNKSLKLFDLYTNAKKLEVNTLQINNIWLSFKHSELTLFADNEFYRFSSNAVVTDKKF